LPMSSGAAHRLQRTIESRRSLLESVAGTKVLGSRRCAFFVLLFSAANVAIAALLLHNHWHALDEPWHGALEFIRYHWDGQI